MRRNRNSANVFEYWFDADELGLPVELPPRRENQGPAPYSENRNLGSPRIIDDEMVAEDHVVAESIPTASEVATVVTLGPDANGNTPEAIDLHHSDETISAKVDETITEERPVAFRQLLSVHALGQFVYCARSAILAAERGDQQDVDEPLPRLTYLPNFDLERIEEVLSQKIRTLVIAVLIGCGLVVPMAIGVVFTNRAVFYSGFGLSLPWLFWTFSLIDAILELASRRRAAMRAEMAEPDPVINQITKVNWWSMLKAGFEPVSYQRPFRHPNLPLEGNPWRVLERGSLRIPVIRSGAATLGPRKQELFPKHRIRLAAYAVLLESTEHVEVPYGVIFPASSPIGLAFPITDGMRDEVERRLHEFSNTFRQSQSGQAQPSPPQERKRCANCRHGAPTPILPPQIHHERRNGKQILILQHRNGQLFHCDCGDRFGSAPPHHGITRRGLSPVVE